MDNRSLSEKNDAFYDRYMPILPSTGTSRKRTRVGLLRLFKVFEDTEHRKWSEAEVAETFTEVVNKHKLAGRLVLALSQHRADSNDPSRLKIDGAFFEGDKAPGDGRPHWADQLVSVEFKSDKANNDPYDDNPKKPFESQSASRKDVRGQIISYADLVFQKQHRTHLFTLIILGRYFRVVRWDRSGAVVTPLVDYVESPDVLYEFLWRLSRLTPTDLGLDPTATLVREGSDHYELMDKMAAAVDDDLPAEHGRKFKAKDKGKIFQYVRNAFRESLDEDWPRYRLQIPVQVQVKKKNTKKETATTKTITRSFLVAKPHFCAKGMAGRGTRGYVALDLTGGKKFVWLKDAWRTFYDLVEPEGAVLQQLNEAHVVNIPTLLCHGDLPGQSTKTPDLWEERKRNASAQAHELSTSDVDVDAYPASPPDRSHSIPSSSLAGPSSVRLGTKRSLPDEEDEDEGVAPPTTTGDTRAPPYDGDCPFRRHIHYRLVVKEVARNLNTFEDGEHLITVVFDCILAHRAAATKANILHRDISGGNILIFPRIEADSLGCKRIQMRGLLTDWELSKDVSNRRPRQARQPERTGTWQYMSAAVISDPTKAVEIPDELESFFHVILYHAVRYIPSTCSNVPQYMAEYFDAYQVQDGQYRCGSKKYATVTQGSLEISKTDGELLFKSPIDNVLRFMLGWIKARYEILTYNANREREVLGPRSEPVSLNPSSSSNKHKQNKFVRDLCAAGGFRPTAKQLKPAASEIQPPSDETIANARNIDDHDTVASIIALILDRDPSIELKNSWKPGDRGPSRKDLCPPGSRGQLKTAPTRLFHKQSSNKRARVDSGAQNIPATPAAQDACGAPGTPEESSMSSCSSVENNVPSQSDAPAPPSKSRSAKKSPYPSVHRMTLRSSASQRTQDSGYASGSRSGPKSRLRR